MRQHWKFAAIFFFFLFAAPIVASADPGAWSTDIACDSQGVYYPGDAVKFELKFGNRSDHGMELAYKLALRARSLGTVNIAKEKMFLRSGQKMTSKSSVSLPKEAPSGSYSLVLVSKADGDTKIETCSFSVIGVD